MKIRLLLLSVSLTLLAGCASNPAAEQERATRLMEYKMQVYGPACEKLGFEKNTDNWRECIQREYEQIMLRMRQNWDYPPPYWRPYYGVPYYRW